MSVRVCTQSDPRTCMRRYMETPIQADLDYKLNIRSKRVDLTLNTSTLFSMGNGFVGEGRIVARKQSNCRTLVNLW